MQGKLRQGAKADTKNTKAGYDGTKGMEDAKSMKVGHKGCKGYEGCKEHEGRTQRV